MSIKNAVSHRLFVIRHAQAHSTHPVRAANHPTSGGKVIGRSINGAGSLIIEVKGTGKDSFLSQVIDLVKQAEARACFDKNQGFIVNINPISAKTGGTSPARSLWAQINRGQTIWSALARLSQCDLSAVH